MQRSNKRSVAFLYCSLVISVLKSFQTALPFQLLLGRESIIISRANKRRNRINHLLETLKSSSTSCGLSLSSSQSKDSSTSSSAMEGGTSRSSNSSHEEVFDKSIWEAYLCIVQRVMNSKRVLKKDKLDDMKEAIDFLLSPPTKSSGQVSDDDDGNNDTNRNENATDDSTNTRITNDNDILENSFCQKYKIKSKSQYDFIMRCLIYMGDACAKEQMAGPFPIVIAWHKLKDTLQLEDQATGTTNKHSPLLRENCISTFMYILSKEPAETTEASAATNSSRNKNNENTRVVEETLNEVATFHDQNFHPNEKTITLRIKHLLKRSKAATTSQQHQQRHGQQHQEDEKETNLQQAIEILNTADGDKNGDEGTTMKKLRTYLPIMEYHCFVSQDPISVLQLYNEMRHCPTVFLDSEFYGLLIGSLARLQMFSTAPIRTTTNDNDNNMIDTMFANTHGPKLFDEIASLMADDILEISENTAKELFHGFWAGFSSSAVDDQNNSTANHTSPSWDMLRNFSSSSPQGVAVHTGTNSLTMGRVTIDDNTAICPITGTKLRLFALDENERQHVNDALLEMARNDYQDFSQKLKKKSSKKGNQDDNTILDDPDYGYRELANFAEWLDSREGDPFTAIVDGPNVAYYGHPNVHYSQVQHVVDNLERMGEKPLVTMSKKYTKTNFMVAGGRWQTLTDDDQRIIRSLAEQGKMYVVPPRCLDDYYWMLASVSNQTNARSCYETKEDYLRVSADNQEGRFPGVRPMLITCDQMRDHKLDLLEPREFRRWSSCHIVNYNISSSVPGEQQHQDSNLIVEFLRADFFSHEIQGNPHGHRKGLVWHLPVSEWNESFFFIHIEA